jgi:MscS family membrane protein
MDGPPMMDWIAELDSRFVTSGVSLLVAIVVALLVRWIALPILERLARRSVSNVDDEILARLHRPIVISILLTGLSSALSWMNPELTLTYVVFGLIKTLAVFMWSTVISGCGVLVLQAMSGNGKIIQTKTLPLFSMVWKVIIFGGATYFLLAAWNINLTTWLASAGVVGIAVGFAAKDTLANLFAGVFILADAPFKIGDFIVIDDVTRGEVTDIGLRSSRLLTRDDVEVTVPNGIIANAKVINETAGPNQKMRVKVKVSVAYGSDAEQVRRVLLGCLDDVPHLCAIPEPRVRFRMLGDSGLSFELLCWIDQPVNRGRVLDMLNERVYEALRSENITIPFPQMDVRVRELPK